MKKIVSQTILAIGVSTVLFGCSNSDPQIEQNNDDTEFLFSREDVSKANDLVKEITMLYEDNQQQFLPSNSEELNENISLQFRSKFESVVPDTSLSVSIADDHDDSSGKDDYVEDPNECRNKAEGAIVSTYEKDCELELVFNTEKLKLGEATEVDYENLNIKALEVPFTYENKNGLDTKFTFVKNNDGKLLIMDGLGFSFLDLQNINERAQNGEGQTDIEEIKKLNLK